MYLHSDLLTVSLEGVDVVVDPLKSHGLVQDSIVSRRMVISGGQEAQGTQSVVDGDYYDLTPGGQLKI